MSDWQPTASIDALKQRAALLNAIRGYFAERGVMEVETPLLASAPVTDPNIEAIATENPLGGEHPLWLQTSPEFAMKRLLVAGSGAIYQICKAFRRGESGARHNPEFTMLEWYRPELSLNELMDEVAGVIALALGDFPAVNKLSYRQVFKQYLNIDPHTASAAELAGLARQHLDVGFDSDDPDLWLQLLMSSVIEPALPAQNISMIYEFPATQAALAKIEDDDTGQPVARRFEAFYRGMELANGYDELQDASELIRRISRDHAQRQAAGQSRPPIDRYLLKAMQSGLPNCVGVAMGFDRLAMLACQAGRIDEVIAFPVSRV
ncbi:EF-P lysine aminoacylase GenX [Spongiibacter sp. KMU-158]|uniref:EF-P lysine aminoacylase GenX n=1 Tax=Spongiibacter pelagi TaxID=2760804 RepID=A0A927GVG9_9GAMM|nr:EF-P lysine aminoacylase EpmA [Spongiibacter pelagi]MBD2858063.1 EF-P lysine aminoacylase GenX [Spongiibacter pelagi]